MKKYLFFFTINYEINATAFQQRKKTWRDIYCSEFENFHFENDKEIEELYYFSIGSLCYALDNKKTLLEFVCN